MKTIIITGASGNLATAVLKTFLEKGYNVVATVRHGSASVEAHPNLEVQPVDASQPEAVRRFVMNVAQKHGSIDGLIHLVGGYAGGRLEDTTPEQVQAMMQLNFETAYYYVQPVLRQMKSQTTGGRIVLVGSRPGSYPNAAKTSVAYGLSKSLVFRLAEIINEEGKGKNVLATVIVPSTIDTPANRKSMPDADFTKWNRPEDIAARMEKFISGTEDTPVIEF